MVNDELTITSLDLLGEMIEERKLGYKLASENINDPYLEGLFRAHSNYSDNLKNGLSYFQTSSHLHLTSFENTHGQWKYWKEMEKALKSHTRKSLLEACINGEQILIDFYSDLLKDKSLPASQILVLQKQLKDVKYACDLLKIFKISL